MVQDSFFLHKKHLIIYDQVFLLRIIGLSLYKARFFKCYERAIFLNSFDSFGRKKKRHCFFEFRNIHSLSLEVCIFSNHSRWVKLGCTSAV